MTTIKKYINQRWSPRAFDSKTVSKTDLIEIFEAAGRAPSAYNEQPWSFILGEKNTESYEAIFECLDEWNKKWAITAPILIIAIAKNNFKRNGKFNPHANYDLGAAVAHLSMKAFEKNLLVHQMAGFNSQLAKTTFKLPESQEAITAIALGYLGNSSSLPEEIAVNEKGLSQRKTTTEFVFEKEWGKAY